VLKSSCMFAYTAVVSSMVTTSTHMDRGCAVDRRRGIVVGRRKNGG
jgi:hypothetical protein